MMNQLKGRTLLVAMAFSLGFTVISCRLIYLQLVQHHKYKDLAIKMHYGVETIPAKRGNILDRNGQALAQTIEVYDLRIDGKLVLEDPEPLTKVAKILRQTSVDLSARINPNNRYILLKRELSEQQYEELLSLSYKPLIFKERKKRIYSNGSHGSHVLGFTNVKSRRTELTQQDMNVEVGMSGVEWAMERYLAGEPGERRIVKDRKKREIAAYRKIDRAPRNGQHVVLTIDQVVQHIVETEADKLIEKHAPENLHIIVADPQTGEILALTNRPTFDPNNRSTMLPASLRNPSIMNVYEPGSTFKVVALAAALSEHIVGLDSKIFCENGLFNYEGVRVADSRDYGTITVRKGLMKSSNIVFAKLGLALGQDRFYRYIRNLGFGEKTQTKGLALNGEEKGILRPPNYWSKPSLTRIPMGYEVAVTNLQMTMAFCAFANGGRLMEPRLVKAVVDEKGDISKEYPSRLVRQVFASSVAEEVLKGLRDVVSEEGTGRGAGLDDLVVGGKTGTAQKVVNHTYSDLHHVASFIGYVGAEDSRGRVTPSFVVSVVVDDPKGSMYYGGQVAVPAFKSIANQIASYMNLRRGGIQTIAKAEDR
ncbi:MAG: penicillin-binding protein 2 [Verrucomicrobiota bacterium]